LIENSPGEHLALLSEHGLSFYIETGKNTVLFDTGQSGSFISNAEQLRIDLSRVDHVVLSHGHYDHSGGLRSLSGLTRKFNLVVGKGFFEEKYAEHNGRHEYLGNNFDRKFLDEQHIHYEELQQPIQEIVPGVHVLGTFPRIHQDETIKDRFKLMKDGVLVYDHFDDEVMLVLDTQKGLVAILGCSHPGMRNMLDAAKERLGKPLYAVLGGTHLVEATPGCMGASLEYLHSSGIKVIGVSHCTGAGAMKVLGETEENYFHGRTGSALII
jgi:7,8-dihydropterin-6-yl-methyl-4-(beta-D-ribofuranosyl)aminobenzene 5'-phosphate synthase